MQHLFRTSALALACMSLGSCVGLEYPDYWSISDNVVVNVVTFPFEVIFTPVIFILKLFPVL